MSYVALYRKWRPKTFDDVVEQSSVVKTLKNSVLCDKVAHAYLFCGNRGTGKTTLARILSRAINCENLKDGNPCNCCNACTSVLSGATMDIVEIDAASNTGVDNIRDVREDTTYVPINLKYKVYIIDEVHMLSIGAFNALLKVLEEPPAQVIFVLATTEPHKIPATILSRCQKFYFKKISDDGISVRLRDISGRNKINIDEDAIKLIAHLADGSMRDAIGILDQCICLGKNSISHSDVVDVAGAVSGEFVVAIIDAILNQNASQTLNLLEQFFDQGKEIMQLISEMIAYIRAIMLYQLDQNEKHFDAFQNNMVPKMISQSQIIEDASGMIRELCSVEQSMRLSSYQRVLLEIGVIKMCTKAVSSNVDVSKNMTAHEEKNAKKHVKYEEAKAVEKAEPIGLPKQNKHFTNNINEWPSILEGMKKDGKVALYANLINSKLVKTGENSISIMFDEKYKFNYEFVSKKENFSIVQNAVHAKFGRNMNLNCVVTKKDGQNLLASPDKMSEMVEHFQSIADKYNVPFNVVDE